MAEVHLFTPESQDDPYPVYARLREQSPVFQEPELGTWALTRYADVYGALQDHETYSSAQGLTPKTEGSKGFSASLPLVMDDPPQHTKVRRLVNTAFTPKRVEAMRAEIEVLTEELLDAIPDDALEMEAVEALAIPLPMIVIARMLGVPESDRERFKRWSDAVAGVLDTDPDMSSMQDMAAERQAAAADMIGYFHQTITARKASPTEDLISLLVQAEIDGENMEDIKLLGFCVLLLLAGNETTTSLIGNLLNVLVDRPDLWEALRADRTLVAGAVEETLRYDSPIQMLWRVTTRPVELHGVTIPKGGVVMVGFASANRDGAEFPDADEFKLDRDWSKHVAFGHGVHYCLGSPLARLEAETALNGLLDRYARIERGEAPARRMPSALLRGFASLPIRLTPG
jgi:cytochrome P450